MAGAETRTVRLEPGVPATTMDARVKPEHDIGVLWLVSENYPGNRGIA